MSRVCVRRALTVLLTVGALPVVPVQAAAVQAFEPSAPDEIVSEGSKSSRRFVVGDMLRTGLATTVEQGPRGVVRVGIGPNFQSSASRDLYFSKLSSAYFEWTAEKQPLIVELWDQGRKIGEYSEGAFSIGTGYTSPRGCPDAATTGLCSLNEQPGPTSVPTQVTQATPEANPAGTVAENRSEHAGLHFTAGLGGGAVRLSCDGCDSETSLAGYLSAAVSVGERILLGIEGTGWTQSEGAQVYSLMAQATGYLNATSDLFVTSGFGLVGRREDSRVGDLTASGFGFSTRLGYELRVGGSVLFIPYVGYVSTLGGAEFSFNGQKVGDYDIRNIQFGLALGLN